MFQDANYVGIVFFVIFVSLGEGIMGPRVLDYIIYVAPEGAEGLYLALSAIPMYFGMVISGVISGLLFNEFC